MLGVVLGMVMATIAKEMRVIAPLLGGGCVSCSCGGGTFDARGFVE